MIIIDGHGPEVLPIVALQLIIAGCLCAMKPRQLGSNASPVQSDIRELVDCQIGPDDGHREEPGPTSWIEDGCDDDLLSVTDRRARESSGNKPAILRTFGTL